MQTSPSLRIDEDCMLRVQYKISRVLKPFHIDWTISSAKSPFEIIHRDTLPDSQPTRPSL